MPAISAEKREAARKELAWKWVDVLHCSYAEAYQMVLDDEAVDRGEKMPWDLTPEQEAEARKARRAARVPKEEGAKTKKKKENPVKAEVISRFVESLQTKATDIEIANAEREFTFKINGVKYKVVLSEPRA